MMVPAVETTVVDPTVPVVATTVTWLFDEAINGSRQAAWLLELLVEAAQAQDEMELPSDEYRAAYLKRLTNQANNSRLHPEERRLYKGLKALEAIETNRLLNATRVDALITVGLASEARSILAGQDRLHRWDAIESRQKAAMNGGHL